jgi:hypothetical protein
VCCLLGSRAVQLGRTASNYKATLHNTAAGSWPQSQHWPDAPLQAYRCAQAQWNSNSRIRIPVRQCAVCSGAVSCVTKSALASRRSAGRLMNMCRGTTRSVLPIG